MALGSPQSHILDTLTALSDDGLETFCLELQIKSEEPRIRAAEVEQKTRVQIAKLLVSRCREAGAVPRTVRTLRGIGCNNEADELERNVSCLNGAPGATDPGPSSSTVQTNGSVQTPPKVTKKRPRTKKSELSKQLLLFGQYKDKSFKWLLQNDVSYAGYLVGSHQKERDGGDTSQTPSMKNKDALAEYVSLFQEAVEEVDLYRRGEELLGFGKYKKLTLKDLYESQDEAKQKYVERLRSRKTYKDPQMKTAAEYIVRRDRKRKPRTSSSSKPPDEESSSVFCHPLFLKLLFVFFLLLLSIIYLYLHQILPE